MVLIDEGDKVINQEAVAVQIIKDTRTTKDEAMVIITYLNNYLLRFDAVAILSGTNDESTHERITEQKF